MIDLHIIAIIAAQPRPAAEPDESPGVLGDLEHPVGWQSIFCGEVAEPVVLAVARNRCKAPPCHQ